MALVDVDSSQYGQPQVVHRDVPDWNRDDRSLFRGDSRTPDEIRADSGFRPPYETRPDWQSHPERNTADIAQHVGGATNAFVSTSTDRGVAKDFAISGHVYVINAPGGIYTDPTLRPTTGKETHGEGEVLFPGGINWDYVRGWHETRYEPGSGFVLGDFHPNPDYIGDRSTTDTTPSTATDTAPSTTDQSAPPRPETQQQYQQPQQHQDQPWSSSEYRGEPGPTGRYGPSTQDATRTGEQGRPNQDTSPAAERPTSQPPPGGLGDRMGRLDDPRLDALRPHLHSTEGGMSAFAPPNATDGSQRYAHKNELYTANQVPSIPGQFVVDMHGSPDAVRVGDTPLSPRDLADVIRANPDYDGGPVSLLGCNTGSRSDGFAAQLAQELGAPVTAPSSDAWVDHNGNVFASSQAYNTDTSKPAKPTWPPNGEWNTYSPTGDQTTHRSPYPPGHTPTWGDTPARPSGAVANRGDDTPPRPDDNTDNAENTDSADTTEDSQQPDHPDRTAEQIDKDADREHRQAHDARNEQLKALQQETNDGIARAQQEAATQRAEVERNREAQLAEAKADTDRRLADVERERDARLAETGDDQTRRDEINAEQDQRRAEAEQARAEREDAVNRDADRQAEPARKDLDRKFAELVTEKDQRREQIEQDLTDRTEATESERARRQEELRGEQPSTDSDPRPAEPNQPRNEDGSWRQTDTRDDQPTNDPTTSDQANTGQTDTDRTDTDRPSDDQASSDQTRDADPTTNHPTDDPTTSDETRDGETATDHARDETSPETTDGTTDDRTGDENQSRAPERRDSRSDGRQAWPTDPSNGAPLRHRDLEALGITEQQVDWWRDGRAPLGMDPDQFRRFQSELGDLLRANGIDPDRSQLRLVGSSVRVFSGWNKTMDGEHGLRHTPESREQFERWQGPDRDGMSERRPFDVQHQLGLQTKPSDYDLSIYSDDIVAAARERWGGRDEFSHPRQGHVDRAALHEAIPGLADFARRWEEKTGRKIGFRLFGLENEPQQRRAPNSSPTDGNWLLDLADRQEPEPRGRPADPASGYELQQRDQDFLGYSDEQLQWWSDGAAPLGMTPRQFHDFQSSLADALRAEGTDPRDVDVRLKGSGVNAYSNPRKTLDDAPHTDDSRALMDEWLGDDPERPTSRPFDSMHRLGIGDPSDFDVQIRSDDLVRLARERFELAPPPPPLDEHGNPKHEPRLVHPKYGFIDKTIMREQFPELKKWVEHWEQELGREVAPALFGLDDGPRQDSHLDEAKAQRGWPMLGPDASPLGDRPDPVDADSVGPSARPDDVDAAGVEPPKRPSSEPPADSPVFSDAPESPPPPPKIDHGDPVHNDDGSWEWKGYTLDPATNAAVDSFIPTFTEVGHGPGGDGGIRGVMQDIEQQVPYTKLEGLQYDIKGEDRLKEKVAERMRAEGGTGDPEAILRGIPDGIRYTFSLDPENYTAGAVRISDELRQRGYECVRQTNAWTSDKPYRGVNSRWRDPESGLIFEVQFHTPESWHVKDVTHDAYEHENNATLSQDVRDSWHDFQDAYFKTIPEPPGADTIVKIDKDKENKPNG